MSNPVYLYSLIITMLVLIMYLHKKKKSLTCRSRQLEEKNSKLLEENNKLYSQIQALTNKLDAAQKVLEKNDFRKNKYFQEKQNTKEAQEEMLNNLSEYFHIKETIISQSEAEMFYFLTTALDKVLSPKERRYYYLFPQVSLYAFTAQEDSLTDEQKKLCLSILGGKHSDFIICHRDYYKYVPVLIVELDDISHFSDKYGKDSFSKTQINDRFKNNLSISLELPLLRYRLSNGRLSDADKNAINDALCKIFYDYHNGISGQIYYYSASGVLTKEQYYNTFGIQNID